MYWILLFGLAAVWILQSVLLHKLWQKELSVTLRFRDHSIYEGETSALYEIVRNNKWLPLSAVEVRIAIHQNLCFTGDAANNSTTSDQTYKRDMFSFLFHQQVTRTLTFTAQKRGLYELATADIKAYDFFFHDLGFCESPQNTLIYVYPGQVDTRRLNILCTAISGTIPVQNQLFPDPFEFSGIREYQPTDPLNRINWKASMRMGTPMVNQYDSTTSMDLALIFDVEDSHIFKNDALVEETIRIVSSLAARLVKARMPVCVFSNASLPDAISDQTDSGLFHMELPAQAGQIAKLNQKLACIDGSTMSGVSLLNALSTEISKDKLCIFISKNTDKDMLEMLQKFATPSNPVFFVIPEYISSELPEFSIPNVRTLIWEVEP